MSITDSADARETAAMLVCPLSVQASPSVFFPFLNSDQGRVDQPPGRSMSVRRSPIYPEPQPKCIPSLPVFRVFAPMCSNNREGGPRRRLPEDGSVATSSKTPKREKVHLRRSEYQSSCLPSICIMAILKIYIQKVNLESLSIDGFDFGVLECRGIDLGLVYAL